MSNCFLRFSVLPLSRHSKRRFYVALSCCRRELEYLRSQQQRASEVRCAEEVRRRKELDASHQELEVQKKYLEEIREEQELARNRAEDEIRQVRDNDSSYS